MDLSGFEQIKKDSIEIPVKNIGVVLGHYSKASFVS